MMFFIKKDGVWFRPEAKGYTDQLNEAGVFDSKTARLYMDVPGTLIYRMELKLAELVVEAENYERKAAEIRKQVAKFMLVGVK